MGCAESDMRKEEVESALAKEEFDELSWIQRLLKTCSNRSTNRRGNAIGPMLMAAVPPEPPHRPDVKTEVDEVCIIANSAFNIFLTSFSLFLLFFFFVSFVLFTFILHVTFKL